MRESRLMQGLLWLWGSLPLPNWLRWVLLWSGNQKFLVGVSAVVFNPAGEVLLCRHTYRDRYPWGLPGGWLKRDEDPAQAVEREICEETGLVIRILQPLRVIHDTQYARLDVTFVGCLIGGVFRPSLEVSDAGFYIPEHYPALLPGTEALIEQARGVYHQQMALGTTLPEPLHHHRGV
jgi:8-oxo-dGTP diphosphatase